MYSQDLSDVPESSDHDSVFGDAEDATDTGDGAQRGAKRSRLSSVPERVKALENRRTQELRRAHGKASQNVTSPNQPDTLNADMLQAIKQMIDSSTSRVIQTFESKFESLQHKIDVMEAGMFSQDTEIKSLREQVDILSSANKQLEDHLESIDVNRRQNSLILTCADFGRYTPSENIQDKTVEVLKKRFPDVNLSSADFQTVHRLQGEDKVIVKFLRTEARNIVFDMRFELAKRPHRLRDMNALFINESLSVRKRQLFNHLLAAKRAGRIYTAYTKRGSVFCKLQEQSEGIRIDDDDRLHAVLAKRPVPPAQHQPQQHRQQRSLTPGRAGPPAGGGAHAHTGERPDGSSAAGAGAGGGRPGAGAAGAGACGEPGTDAEQQPGEHQPEQRPHQQQDQQLEQRPLQPAGQQTPARPAPEDQQFESRPTLLTGQLQSERHTDDQQELQQKQPPLWEASGTAGGFTDG